MADDPAQDLMLSALIRGIPIPAVVIGPDERIAAINGQAEELFDLKGQGRHYITALRQPSVLDAIEATLADGKPRTGQYFGTEGSKDTTWRVAVSSVPMGVGNGVLLGFENITLLEEAGQMRRDFVANVSHELRTPLTALLGFVETLKGPARDDAAARDKFLGIMESEAGRMARLVEDLLSLSRVEEDERVRPMAVVDLRDLISSTVDLISPLAETAGVALEIAVPDVSVEVPGDAEQLRQVLRNLVENAIKYGAAGERVAIRLEEPTSEPALRTEGVRLSVRDWGEGIAPHHIARLTERFYRVDSHRSREVGGTGLGLAIVKHIINRHRGRLRVESELGEGATFTLILPLT